MGTFEPSYPFSERKWLKQTNMAAVYLELGFMLKQVHLSTHQEIQKKNSKDDVALALSYLPEIEESLQNQTKSWNTLKSLELSKDKVTSLFKKEGEVSRHLNDRTVLANAVIKITDPQVVIKKCCSSTSSIAESSEISDSTVLKMEKAKYPIFSGDIRCYSRFKTDFNDFVVPSNKDPMTQAHALK